MDFYPLQVNEEDFENQVKAGDIIAAISFTDFKTETGRPDAEYYRLEPNSQETRDAFTAWAKKEFGYLRYQLWFPKK